ncbi:DUF6943 family protein [Chryseobacterium sp. MP_3.2]|uniref:DUF6943 family protein n=1 Tax=Chryseobacterium sp. MP_3.2 TaxID=3071712 RepID=UPI002E0A4821|nr:hypothetical protein [Chryseobacterium sp. MP_3.2]
MQIKTYNGTTAEPKANEFIFFIQSHGFNAGRPLKKPIPNCWEVRTERKADFEILFIIFESKILMPFFRGSVIPFIALGEYKNIIAPILKNAIHENKIINAHYLQIRKIEQQQENQIKIQSLMIELKKSLSRECFKKIKTAI